MSIQAAQLQATPLNGQNQPSNNASFTPWVIGGAGVAIAVTGAGLLYHQSSKSSTKAQNSHLQNDRITYHSSSPPTTYPHSGGQPIPTAKSGIHQQTRSPHPGSTTIQPSVTPALQTDEKIAFVPTSAQKPKVETQPTPVKIHSRLDALAKLNHEQVQNLIEESLARNPIGTGKFARVDEIKTLPQYVLRSLKQDTYNSTPINKMNYLPVRYDGQLAFLNNETNIGVPRGVFVPQEHYLNKQGYVPASIALADDETRKFGDQEEAIQFSVLNKCEGKSVGNGGNDAICLLSGDRDYNKSESELISLEEKFPRIRKKMELHEALSPSEFPIAERLKMLDASMIQGKSLWTLYKAMNQSGHSVSQFLEQCRMGTRTEKISINTNDGAVDAPISKEHQQLFEQRYKSTIKIFKESIRENASLPQESYDAAISLLHKADAPCSCGKDAEGMRCSNPDRLAFDMTNFDNCAVNAQRKFVFYDVHVGHVHGNFSRGTEFDDFARMLIRDHRQLRLNTFFRQEDIEETLPDVQEVFDKIHRAVKNNGLKWHARAPEHLDNIARDFGAKLPVRTAFPIR